MQTYPSNPQGPPPAGVYQPGHGQPGYSAYGQPVGQPSNVVVITQPGAGYPRQVGNCPHCGIGMAKTEYTLLGLILCFLFFPLGMICCLLMTERRCSHCHAKL